MRERGSSCTELKAGSAVDVRQLQAQNCIGFPTAKPGSDAAEVMCMWWHPRKAPAEIKMVFGTGVLQFSLSKGSPQNTV